jgi:hypothetical protein
VSVRHSARLTECPGATHAFLSSPGLVPQAKAARAVIAEFFRGRLAVAKCDEADDGAPDPTSKDSL